MDCEAERNIRLAEKTKTLLEKYRDEAPPSLEVAITLLHATGGPAYYLDDPESLAIDLLTGLRHYARLLAPEQRLLQHVREYCRDHDVNWEASVSLSEEHFEIDVECEEAEVRFRAQ
jgi:hypothetical protein